MIIAFLMSMSLELLAVDNETEVIHGLSFDNGGISFKVVSGGCTRKEDFSYQIVEGEKALELKIVRVYRDRCKRLPFFETIFISYEELGLEGTERVRIINPIDIGYME